MIKYLELVQGLYHDDLQKVGHHVPVHSDTETIGSSLLPVPITKTVGSYLDSIISKLLGLYQQYDLYWG